MKHHFAPNEIRRHQDGANETEEATLDWRSHKFDADLALDIQRFIQTLPINERRVIILRFFESATLKECGETMGGLSPERIRQIEMRALRRLAPMLRKAGFKTPPLLDKAGEI